MSYRNLIKLPKVKVATGLYSHLDSIIEVDREVLEWIKKSRAVKPTNLVLNSIEEVVYTLKKSKDNESLISRKVYDELDSFFPKREIRLGGNGNNMGRALFELGITPLVSYPIRSEEIMRASPNFKVSVGNRLTTPIKAIRKNDPDYDHIIFESKKWRDILCWDLMTSRGVFDRDFLKLAFNPNFTDISIISYAHLLLPSYKKRTDYVLEFIKKERPKIHLEFGLGSLESMRYAMEKFSENDACDSWGLDEEECKIYLKASSEDKKDLIEAALKAIKEFSLKRICIHSSKFAFSISKYDVRKEIEALSDGCLAAGVKAFGKNITKRIIPIKRKLNNYNFCLVPTFYTTSPKVLIGLGDVLAAVQAVKTLA